MSTSAVSKGNVHGPMQQLTKTAYDSSGPDATACKSEHWVPGVHKFVGEPLFVARPSSECEDDGWVLVLVHDGENISTELAILDAQQISAGPIATLKLPRYIPMGVHGSWTDEYILGPPALA
jgi:all-trans-8'-apo-beta-carotenal 15,15'-oxygenase